MTGTDAHHSTDAARHGHEGEDARTGSARGEPGRYRYARAERRDLSLSPDRAVELALRSHTGIVDGPIPRSALDRVDGLRLDLRRPADLSLLSGLRNLRWLALHSPVPVDLAALATALAPLPALTDLSIVAPVSDVTPLAALTGLSVLRLEGTRVVDLSPLTALDRLTDLAVCDGPLADLTPLSGLPLTRLFVYRTQVRDLAPLAGMPTLQVLGLVGCPVRDLSAVATLPALHFVNLRGTPAAAADLPDCPGVTFEGVGEGGGSTPPPQAGGSGGRRRGPADLLAAYRAAGDDRWTLLPSLLASRDRGCVQEALRAYAVDDGPQVTGLLLVGGRGDVPFPANAWAVPPTAGLAEALDRVWAPLADLAPALVSALRHRTLGLALLSDGRLGYVVADDEVTGADDLDRLPEFTGHGYAVLFGGTPRSVDPGAVLPVLAGPVPRPVRDLWAVHDMIDSSRSGHVGGRLDVNTLGFFDRDGWDVVSRRLGGLPPDRFVHGVGGNDFLAYLLDLDLLDDAGNPTVACWAFKEWAVGEHRQFWDWLDNDGLRTILPDT